MCEVAEGYDDKEYMRQTGYRSHIPQFAFAFFAKSHIERIDKVELLYISTIENSFLPNFETKLRYVGENTYC